MHLGSTESTNSCLVVKKELTKKLNTQTLILTRLILTGKGSGPFPGKIKKDVDQLTPLMLMKQLCLDIQNVFTPISKAKKQDRVGVSTLKINDPNNR